MDRCLANRTPHRGHLQRALRAALRELGPLSRALDGCVAAQLGINATDLRCLRLLQHGKSRTAGRLAREGGLTTGATTAVLDRLERAGLARRTRDSVDRRRVIVHIAPVAPQRLHALDTVYRSRIRKAAAGLTTRQLTLVLDYMMKVAEIGAAHSDWLQRASPELLHQVSKGGGLTAGPSDDRRIR